MGWAHGFIKGREVGYGVAAVCDKPGCGAKIDRGLSYLCGELESDEECGGYFCADHLFLSPRGQVCKDCHDRIPEAEMAAWYGDEESA